MAYDFNGSTAKISWGDVALLDGLTAFEWHLWINLDTLGGLMTLVEKQAPAGFRLLADDGSALVTNGLFGQYDDSVGGVITPFSAASVLSTSAGWQEVGVSVLTNSATGMKYYVGGTASGTPGDTTSFGAFPNNAQPLLLGAAQAGDRFFDGQMAELSAWNRVLTGPERADLAAAKSALFVPSGLIFYARLNADAIDEINANTGTITAATPTTHPSITYPGAGVLITQLERRARGLNRGVARGVA